MSEPRAVRSVRSEYVGQRCVTVTLWRRGRRGAAWYAVEVDGSTAWTSNGADEPDRLWALAYCDGVVMGLRYAEDARADCIAVVRRAKASITWRDGGEAADALLSGVLDELREQGASDGSGGGT